MLMFILSSGLCPVFAESKFEELQVKYNKEVEERKKLVAELKSVMSQVSLHFRILLKILKHTRLQSQYLCADSEMPYQAWSTVAEHELGVQKAAGSIIPGLERKVVRKTSPGECTGLQP